MHIQVSCNECALAAHASGNSHTDVTRLRGCTHLQSPTTHKTRMYKHMRIMHAHTWQAGILIGLVFLHLIPEASAMAGSNWELSSLIVAGYLFSLLTEHVLYVLGFEHAHAGHTSHSSKEERALLECGSDVLTSHAQVAHSHSPLEKPDTVNTHAHDIRSLPPHDGRAYSHADLCIRQTFQAPSINQPHQGVAPAAIAADSNTVVTIRNNLQGSTAVTSPANIGSESRTLEAGVKPKSCCKPLMSAVVINILVGDAFHNLFDGIAIAAAFGMCNGEVAILCCIGLYFDKE